MTRTQRADFYLFSELPERTKERVLAQNEEVFNEWAWNDVTELLETETREKMKALGIGFSPDPFEWDKYGRLDLRTSVGAMDDKTYYWVVMEKFLDAVGAEDLKKRLKDEGGWLLDTDTTLTWSEGWMTRPSAGVTRLRHSRENPGNLEYEMELTPAMKELEKMIDTKMKEILDAVDAEKDANNAIASLMREKEKELMTDTETLYWSNGDVENDEDWVEANDDDEYDEFNDPDWNDFRGFGTRVVGA